MKITKVTILIACFQSERYIKETLQSVLDSVNFLEGSIPQTQGPTPSKCRSEVKIQILIVNDGSTDKTEEIVKIFIEETKKVNIDKKINIEFTYIEQPNQGQTKAIENSLEYIKGDIVLLLDSDDRFLKPKIESVIQAFENNPECVMVSHPQLVIDCKGNPTGKKHPELALLSCGDIREIAKKTGRIIAPATSGLCFKTETFIKIHPSPAVQYKPYDLPDLYLALAASLEGPILALETPLSEYRKHKGGKFFNILNTEEGLDSFLSFQKAMEEKLSIRPAPNSNSFVARLKFAKDKMTSNPKITKETNLQTLQSLQNLKTLLLSTLLEKNFKAHHQIMMCILWIGLACLPKCLFKRIWTELVKKQTNG